MAVVQHGVTARRRTRFDREALTAYLFIFPAVLGFLVFFLVPAVRAFGTSFTEWNLLSPPKFVGLANYRELWKDPLFWNGVRVTLRYVLWNIPAQVVIGMFLAFMLHRVARSSIWRSLVIYPYLLSNVTAALVFLWLFDPILGFANQALSWIGIEGLSYFGSESGAIRSIAFVNIWRHMGLTGLLFFAGMQAIPSTMYEAAKLDGASEWDMFRRVTLPLLRPVTAFVVITSLIGSFQIFDTIAVTQRPPGSPIDTTRTLVVYINQKALNGESFMGYASAMVMVLLVFLILLAVVQLKLFRSDESALA
jgi:multiple sugar transport system permease protein